MTPISLQTIIDLISNLSNLKDMQYIVTMYLCLSALSLGDFFTGFLKAFRNRKFISIRGWIGAARKALTFIIIANMQQGHIPTVTILLFASVFALMEIFSVLENLRDCSFAFSPFIARYIPQGISEEILKGLIHAILNGAEEPLIRIADAFNNRKTTTDTTATVTAQTAQGPVETTAQVHMVTQPAQASQTSQESVQAVQQAGTQ